MYLNANRYLYVNTPLYHYYVNNQSVTRKKGTNFLSDRFLITEMLNKYVADHNLSSLYKVELEYLLILYNYANFIPLYMKLNPCIDRKFLNELKKTFKKNDYKNNKWFRSETSRMSKITLQLFDFSTIGYIIIYRFYYNLKKIF